MCLRFVSICVSFVDVVRVQIDVIDQVRILMTGLF